MFSMMATVQLSMADWKRSTGSLSAWKEKNIRFFSGGADPDPNPYPYVFGLLDPDPDPSIIMQKYPVGKT
jgi:hypothetical protein